MKAHRVGTITLGSMLITFGTLFLLRIFFSQLSYDFILKLWPIIFLLLGGEILISSLKQPDGNMIYDKAAFFLIILLSFFAMGMALMEFLVTNFNIFMNYL